MPENLVFCGYVRFEIDPSAKAYFMADSSLERGEAGRGADKGVLLVRISSDRRMDRSAFDYFGGNPDRASLPIPVKFHGRITNYQGESAIEVLWKIPAPAVIAAFPPSRHRILDRPWRNPPAGA